MITFKCSCVSSLLFYVVVVVVVVELLTLLLTSNDQEHRFTLTAGNTLRPFAQSMLQEIMAC